MNSKPPRGGLVVLLIMLFIGALVGGGAWLMMEVGRTSRLIRESEVRQLAMKHVCGLIATYVERSGFTKWPRSWEDLLQGAEGGGFAGGWAPSGPRVEELVTIDFDADLKVLQQQEAAEFTAVRPAKGATNVIGEVQGLLARIRGPVQWQVPQSEGPR